MMLFYLVMICLAIANMLQAIPHDNFELIIEPRWQNLDGQKQTVAQFGGKWVLVGSITFRKKAKEQVDLNKLFLRWKGPAMETLMGSLYRKTPDKDFMPIQDNLICDGTWNKAQQTLKLTFDQKQSLGPTNIFYLVLTVPEKLESVIKNGQFEIVQHALPEPYRPNKDSQLLLSLDAVAATTGQLPQ